MEQPIMVLMSMYWRSADARACIPTKRAGILQLSLSCREGVSELSGEGFEHFGEEFRTVLGCSGRDVVAVEPCYFVHSHGFEYERLEVAVDKRLDDGGIFLRGGDYRGAVYVEAWHQRALGSGVVDNAFEESAVEEAFEHGRHHSPPYGEDEDNLGCALQLFVVMFHLFVQSFSLRVDPKVVDSEHGIEVLVVEVYYLIVAAVVGEFLRDGVENGMVEALVVRMAVNDGNHDGLIFAV